MTSAAATPVCVRVPGKINLDLTVGRRRDDGYHPLATVFHAVSVFDEVVVSATGSGDPLELAVVGDRAGVPDDGTNLAVRAARLLQERTGVDAGARIELHKQIPVAGGMAGGSADAAGALVACDAVWGTGMSRDELLVLAAELGSDVSFALVGGTALGSGRGEHLTPVLARGHYEWVLAVSDEGLSTADVYAEFDRLTRGGPNDAPGLAEPRVADSMMQALRQGDSEALGAVLHNDLQRAAVSLRPQLSQVLDVGIEYGALGGLVSGSGPTVAFLASDHEQALDLSVALTASGVCSQVRRASGPVPGARITELPRVR
ncbi:MAG TPA: 4-(cytidine 5'-diphospho)-2-C-methyl-D-erythritol kinase [Actinomycetales bacterium]|nr:4-(cytidine 5'-diphospho)-2-C-methyl-D-erythritol kinase [Actinomycetales bacterium]